MSNEQQQSAENNPGQASTPPSVGQRGCALAPENDSGKCGNITLDLREASLGNQAAGRRAFEMLYPELEKLARFWIRKKQGKISGLDRMSIVAMSAYDELAERIFDKTVRSKSRGSASDWENRQHFLKFVWNNIGFVVLNLLRKRQREENRFVDDLQNVANDCDQTLRDTIADVQSALEKIDGYHRELINQRYFLDLTLQEMANYNQTPLTTIDRHVKQAFAELRRHLSKYDQPHQ